MEMSEIEKMYKLANVKEKEYCDRDSDACMSCCPEWKNRQSCWKYKSVMPLFTAEKQLELIKVLISKWYFGDIRIGKDKDNYKGEYCLSVKVYGLPEISIHNKDFKEGLAELSNALWQSLTEEEKQQIKGILE